VFNLLLDFLEPLEHLGYSLKGVSLSSKLVKAYADDLTLLTMTAKGNQLALNRVETWLNWTVTMKAKPKKCVCVGYRVFGPKDKSQFVPVMETSYSAFDPKLMIAGERFKFILDLNQPEESLKRSHFKFLGRWTGMKLKDFEVANFVKQEFLKMMEIVGNDPVNGLMKLWMYQNFVLSKFSWPFMIYNFSITFMKKLEAKSTAMLKKWAGVFKKADPSILYRPRNLLGLQLTSLSSHFQKLQVCKCLLLENSIDQNIRSLYSVKASKESSLKCWRATKVTQQVKSMAMHRIKFPHQANNLGLGWGNYNPNPSPSDFRKLVTAEINVLENEKFMSHAVALPLQGTWTNWVEHGEPFDLSWKNLIYGPGTKLISFVLNSISNSVISPYMLNLMGYAESKMCPLCQHQSCSIFHILSNCKYSVKERYSWRHDSVLETLHPVLSAHLQDHNQKVQSDSQCKQFLLDNFVRAGEVRYWKKAKKTQKHWLSGFFDWKLLIDYSCDNIVFPPMICATDQRPDIIIYSVKAKHVIMIELTCPAEENFDQAHLRKVARYVELQDLISQSGWTSKLTTIEVGVRGLVAHSVRRVLLALGLSSTMVRKIGRALSLVVARCSYAIWLKHSTTNWEFSLEHDDLVKINIV